jgi:hypothetical protein
MLFTADAWWSGQDASLNKLSSRFETLLERCMASIAFQDRQGKICPWRKGRAVVIAGLEAPELLVGESQNGTVIATASLTQALQSGGFKVMSVMKEDAGEDSWPGMLPIEKARALGCSLSCIGRSRVAPMLGSFAGPPY